jgi:hypothetical protein
MVDNHRVCTAAQSYRFVGVCFQPMAEARPSSGTFGGLGDGTTEYMIGQGELDRIKQFVMRAGFLIVPKD